MRLYQRRQWPLCEVDLRYGLEVYARQVVERLKRIRYEEGCGAYVLANALGEVYVLSEASTSTAGIVRRNEEEIVGLYAAQDKTRRNGIIPPLDQVVGDLRAQFIDIGFITPSDVYDAIRYGAGE